MGRGGGAGRRGVTDMMMINSDCSLGTHKTHKSVYTEARSILSSSPARLHSPEILGNQSETSRAQTSCCHCRAGDTEGRSVFTVGQRGNAAAALHSVDKVSSVLGPDQGEESQVSALKPSPAHLGALHWWRL